MLPVLFTVTIQPSWGLWVWMAVSIAVGAWQWRGARKAGENPRQALKASVYWTAGSAVVLFAAVRALGGQNILNLSQPLAVPVPPYGSVVAGGCLIAMSMAARAAERSGLDKEKVLDLSFGILVAAMIGSRVLFIIVNWDEYAHDLVGIFEFWKGGLVFYGGFIGAGLFSLLDIRRPPKGVFSPPHPLAPPVGLPHPPAAPPSSSPPAPPAAPPPPSP